MEHKEYFSKKERNAICVVVLLCCLVLAWIDGVWKPAYGIKAALKIFLFFTFIFSIMIHISIELKETTAI